MRERYKRQSFLGENSQDVISSKRVGVIGLGGGGSHIVQQLAHIGFLNYVIVDFDIIEDSNLNRLTGGTVEDVKNKERKLNIASRMIRGLQPESSVQACNSKWQLATNFLESCDLIFSCLDSLDERDQVERFSRENKIPLMDIGMVVKQFEGEAPYISGQVIASIPERACFRCLDFVTDENLGKEDVGYGDVGDNPQVVWANGVLASTAVGIGINLLVNWTGSAENTVYLVYDGNKFTVDESLKLKLERESLKKCDHF